MKQKKSIKGYGVFADYEGKYRLLDWNTNDAPENQFEIYKNKKEALKAAEIWRTNLGAFVEVVPIEVNLSKPRCNNTKK